MSLSASRKAPSTTIPTSLEEVMVVRPPTDVNVLKKVVSRPVATYPIKSGDRTNN